MKNIAMFFLLSLGLVSTTSAQEKVHLRLIAAAIGDSIVLRWAVANPEAWMKANVAGYVLERTTLDKNNQVIGSAFEQLGPDPIHPWRYSELEKHIDRNDTFALVAAQCLYGKTMRTAQVSGDFIKALQEADEEAINRHGYAVMAADFSAHAADLLGWRYVDRNTKKGNKYIYSLRCQLIKGQALSDTAMFIVKPEEYTPLHAMEAPTLVSGEKLVVIHWKRPAHLSAFFIERSSDGKKFERLNKTPFMDWTAQGMPKSDSLTWIDSIGSNYKVFFYRLVGINAFAQLSPPSAAVRGMGADRTPPLPATPVQGVNVRDGVVKLSWELPPYNEALQGLIVAKTSDPLMSYKALHDGMLPANTTEFVDEKALQFGTNYYTVGLVDTAGNIVWSPLAYVVMTDFSPPVQPLGLHGSIDTAGNVKLFWNLGPDYDLRGYQVYVANQADHEFIPLADSLITDTVFQYKIDLRNLTEHIFFRIRSFDKNLKSSEFSGMLELKKPDVIAPDAPVFDNYKVEERSVYLHWRPSAARDVAKQLLLRRAFGGNWQTLTILPISSTSYTDTVPAVGQLWEYALQALDDDGLRSELSFPVGVKILPATKKKMIVAFSAIWDEAGKKVFLKWSTNPDCDHLLLYRAYADGGLELCARIAGTAASFYDAIPQKGKYKYALKPLFTDGTEGPLSEIIVVETP